MHSSNSHFLTRRSRQPWTINELTGIFLLPMLVFSWLAPIGGISYFVQVAALTGAGYIGLWIGVTWTSYDVLVERIDGSTATAPYLEIVIVFLISEFVLFFAHIGWKDLLGHTAHSGAWLLLETGLVIAMPAALVASAGFMANEKRQSAWPRALPRTRRASLSRQACMPPKRAGLRPFRTHLALGCFAPIEATIRACYGMSSGPLSRWSL